MGEEKAEQMKYYSMVTILIFLLCGCASSQKPVTKKQLVHSDITKEVQQYQKLALDYINKEKQENKPKILAEFSRIESIIQNNNTICINNEIVNLKTKYNLVREKYALDIEKQYRDFEKDLDRNLLPYTEYLGKNFGSWLSRSIPLEQSASKNIIIENSNFMNISKLDFMHLRLTRQNDFILKDKTKKYPYLNMLSSFHHEKDSRYILDIHYDYIYSGFLSTVSKKVHKVNIGNDKFLVSFDSDKSSFSVQAIQQKSQSPSHIIYNLDGIALLIKKALTNRELIASGCLSVAPEIHYPKMQLDSLISEAKETNDKIEKLSSINDKDLFCMLFEMNWKPFEVSKDVSITSISIIKYKNKKYLNINLVHLNILNNVNIKLNDIYKISRYLFDRIVRGGLRVFPDVLSNSQLDGLRIRILSSEKNFVSKNENVNFVTYDFYLPKKEIFQYINDDITGQKLADSSVILVDGERIELR